MITIELFDLLIHSLLNFDRNLIEDAQRSFNNIERIDLIKIISEYVYLYLIS